MSIDDRLRDASSHAKAGRNGTAFQMLAAISRRRLSHDQLVRLVDLLTLLSTTRDKFGVDRRASSLLLEVRVLERKLAAVDQGRLADYEAAGLSSARARSLALMRSGPYSVRIVGGTRNLNEVRATALLTDSLGYTKTEAARALERGVHISPETVVFEVSQGDAVKVKQRLETAGVRVRIEDVPRREAKQVRLSIPESVRHEVWRRDGGRCVDCGSRENLHFDHIIPWSRGGANTARNIELRCEPCNLKKGAKI